MSEHVARYQDAFERLENADKELSALKVRAQNLNSALSRPNDIVLPGAAAVSARTFAGHGQQRLDVAPWPTSGDIVAMVQEWKVARAALEEEWKRVPTERRTSLVGPENAPGGTSRR